MSKVADAVTNLIKEPVESLGYELVDVEYRKQHSDMTLTVYIHSAEGVTLDDCEKVSRLIDPMLDELNPTDDTPYVFNVSSPGLDRPIKTDGDFKRNMGKEVEVKLYAPLNNTKEFEAVLTGFEGGVVSLRTLKDGEILELEQNKIALIRQLIRFE